MKAEWCSYITSLCKSNLYKLRPVLALRRGSQAGASTSRTFDASATRSKPPKCSRLRHFRRQFPAYNTPPFPPPVLSQATYFGSLASELKMDFSRSTLCHRVCGTYGTRSPTVLHACLPAYAPVSELDRLHSFQLNPEPKVMNRPSLQSRPVSSCLYWMVPVLREETLAVQEKFRKVSWRRPNYKPLATNCHMGQESLGQVRDS